MAECNGYYIQSNPSVVLSKEFCASDQEEIKLMESHPYREVVGSVMYLMLATRPDLAFAVQECSQFMVNPGITHWHAVKTILRYIKHAIDYGLILGGVDAKNTKFCHQLEAFCDSDFANHDDRKPSAGYMTQLDGSVISWCSQAERTVALHTTEAEYIALSMTVQEEMHLRMK